MKFRSCAVSHYVTEIVMKLGSGTEIKLLAHLGYIGVPNEGQRACLLTGTGGQHPECGAMYVQLDQTLTINNVHNIICAIIMYRADLTCGL